MIAVIFESQPHAHQLGAYLDAAARLRPLLERFDGFISIERFESLATPGKILSLSYWRDAEAVRRWRNVEAHRSVQRAGRESVFADYHLHVAEVIRAYGMNDRDEAPEDSRVAHDSVGAPFPRLRTGGEPRKTAKRSRRTTRENQNQCF